jgi:hypothetical protein
MIAAEPVLTWKGLTWEVVQRLDSLEGIEQWLVDRKDDLKLLETVAAIKKAYRSGTLAWNDVLVTYWSHGLNHGPLSGTSLGGLIGCTTDIKVSG